MLKVLTKTATFVENVWHAAGEEIVIAEHHFSEEVHTLLEDLGLKKASPTVIPIDKALKAMNAPAPIEELPK